MTGTGLLFLLGKGVSKGRRQGKCCTGETSSNRLTFEEEPLVTQEEEKLQEKLLDYIEDAHAMEESVLRMLDSMISTTDDPEIAEMLRHHKEETEQHEQRLSERLEALGRDTPALKEAPTIAGALAKSVADQVRTDKAAKNARDGYATEHMEIACYELLERLAIRAGDLETGEVARANRADEEAMAQKIASNWDKFLDLSLAEEGIRA
jgi:ferritin-like metal-binding protein YciE